MTITQLLSKWMRRREGAPSPSPISVLAGVPLADDSPLIRLTAERLRQREQAEGGWAAEAGGLPVEAYLPAARRIVQQVALGGSEGGAPAL